MKSPSLSICFVIEVVPFWYKSLSWNIESKAMESQRDCYSRKESVLTKIEQLYELRQHYNKLSGWAKSEMYCLYALDCCHGEAAARMKALKDDGDEIDDSQCKWHREYAKKCEARYEALTKAHQL